MARPIPGDTTLQLRALDWQGPDRWRWLLEDPDGVPLADHEVQLDRNVFEFGGFVDLYRFLRRHADPDRRTESEAELVERVGGWIAESMLGVGPASAILDRAPVTVRVIVPLEADWLIYRPWETANINGLPLAKQDVSLIFELEGDPLREKLPVQEALRLLAVFSLPATASVLALRRERFELARLIRELRARNRRNIELTTLQYGVTRQRLRDAVLEGAGWDLLHVSGHGLADGLLLEREDGGEDLIETEELASLLRPALPRLKFVVLSSCQSGAATAAQTLRWLQLDQPAANLDATADAEAGTEQDAGVAGLGRALVRALDVAVLAMRFPISDEFAIQFGRQLYELLLGRGQPLDTALRLGLPEVARSASDAHVPAISAATPALFGRRAEGLTLAPPLGPVTLEMADIAAMAAFPPEPPRFVGRSEVMAKANSALAPRSGRSGVLLHGMAGAGKTTCALELAYGAQNAFSGMAFWAAPKREEEALASLPVFAQSLEIQLGAGFEMVHAVGNAKELDAYLPRLTELFEQQGILIVLDNIESLLSESGGWRDPRWRRVIEALTGHSGESRLIATSRVIPSGLASQAVLRLSVHALSLAESVVLAREMPNLGRLMRARPGGARPDAGDADLARRAIGLVKGHPKLLELIDAEAADPVSLASRLGPERDGPQLENFFRTGTSELEPDEYVAVLADWTRTSADKLPETSQLMLMFLSCLEDTDRTALYVDHNWSDLWRRLGKPGDAPSTEDAIEPVAEKALVDVRSHVIPGREDNHIVIFDMHPGIAETIRTAAPQVVRAAVDIELADYWIAVASRATEEGNTMLVQAAALAGTPYLLRLERWGDAAMLLERALGEPSPARMRRTLPYVRRLEERTRGTNFEVTAKRLLGLALRSVDVNEAEVQLRRARTMAVLQGDERAIDVTTTDLIDLLSTRGKFGAALELSDEQLKRSVSQRVELSNRIQRLQLLSLSGEHETVLTEFEGLREQLETLTKDDIESEGVPAWSMREVLMSTGMSSAIRLEKWELALTLNEEVLLSLRRRSVTDFEFFQMAYNSVAALRELGRVRDAEELLDACQKAFEEVNATSMLGNVYAARANIEERRDHLDAAIRLRETALRLHYVDAEPAWLIGDHINFARSLLRCDRCKEAVSHIIAGAFIGVAARAADRVRNGFASLQGRSIDEGSIPTSIDQVILVVEKVEGVRFREHVEALFPDASNREKVFDAVVAEVRRRVASSPPSLS